MAITYNLGYNNTGGGEYNYYRLEEMVEQNQIKKDRQVKWVLHARWAGIIFILALLLCTVRAVNAATMYINPSAGNYTVGQSFTATIILSSTDAAVNAVSGNLSFPTDKLEVASVSKSSTIVSLWVVEPVFYNNSGIVQFEGIILNPGYTGSAGRIIQVAFRTKAAGAAKVSFTSGSILANDGKGTNILTGLGSGTYNISPKAVGEQPAESTSPVEVSGTPLAPKVSSVTHPNPDAWFNNNDPTFTWTMPAGVTGVNVLADRNPSTNPGTRSDGLRSSYTFNDVDDGQWYFHVRLLNNNGWGAISHFRFQVDTTSPKSLVLEFPGGKTATSARPLISLNTSDAESGIARYKILIDAEKIEVAAGELIEGNLYQLPALSAGTHTILAQAFDQAGNSVSTTDEFAVAELPAPELQEYPREMRTNDILTIKGKVAYAASRVTINLQPHEGAVNKQSVVVDDNGYFILVYKEKLAENTYQVWAQAETNDGALSAESEKVIIAVRLPWFLKFGKIALDYLTLMTTIIVLIAGIILIAAFGWYRINLWRKKIAKVSKLTQNTEHDLRKAFARLREEVEDQVAKLDTKPGLSKKEMQISDRLKKALQETEVKLEGEVEDIEKGLK